MHLQLEVRCLLQYLEQQVQLEHFILRKMLMVQCQFLDAAIDANAADKDATVLAAVSAIDKARAKGVIKKNTASRKISRMAKRANKNA